MIDTLQVIADSLYNDKVLVAQSNAMIGFDSILEYAYKIAMVAIAIFNAIFTIYIYNSNSKTSRKTKDADRKIALLKSLILDYNLQSLYNSFAVLEEDLSALKKKECNKSDVEKRIQADFRRLNEQFINFLEAVDGTLYQSMLEACDQCRDEIVDSISNEGVNLWVDKQYKELILMPLNAAKKKMLSQLFNYRG